MIRLILIIEESYLESISSKKAQVSGKNTDRIIEVEMQQFDLK